MKQRAEERSGDLTTCSAGEAAVIERSAEPIAPRDTPDRTVR